MADSLHASNTDTPWVKLIQDFQTTGRKEHQGAVNHSLSRWNELINSPGKKTRLRRSHHPPVITIFIGGMVTIPKWVVYCCFKGVEFDHDHRSNDPSMLVRSMLYHGKTHSDFFTEVHILSFPIIRVPQKYCFPYSTYTNSLNDNLGSMTLKPWKRRNREQKDLGPTKMLGTCWQLVASREAHQCAGRNHLRTDWHFTRW